MEVEGAEEAEVGKNRAEEDAVGKNRAEEDAVGKNRRPQGASATAHANDSAVHTPPPPASALEGAAQGSSAEMIPSFPSTLDVKELQQLGNANKTQERVDAHAPDLLGGSKRIELIKIKKEQLLGGVERTQEPFHADDPTNKAGIEKTQVDGAEHDLSQFAEKDDASKKQRLKKNKRKRRELEKINEEQCLGGANKTQLLSSTLRWHASYSILFFDHQRMSKVCERNAEDNAEEHLKEVDTIIKSLFREYSNEMGETHVDPSEEEELQFDELEEVEDPLADWEAHLKVQKKQATSELDRYLSEELFPRQKDFDILGWWEMHSPKYPVLSCIARDVLAIQASTVASESSFSAGGRIISDHRTRLKSDTVEGLICLQDWLKAADPKPTNKDVEEYFTKQASARKKIVLARASLCPPRRRCPLLLHCHARRAQESRCQVCTATLSDTRLSKLQKFYR